jgi:hypothetical protein
MLQIIKTDSKGFFAKCGNVSAHFKNTFKKTRFLGQGIYKRVLNAVSKNPAAFFVSFKNVKFVVCFIK